MTQKIPTSMRCGTSGSKVLSIGVLFANTVLCVAVTGATKWHPCLGPVKARSRRSLDIPGMTVFMCGGNRLCYLPANGGGPSKDLQIACRPSFNTLFTLQSYPVIDDNI